MKTEFYRGSWSSVLGVPIMRKRADQPNEVLVFAVVEKKDEALQIADAIVGLLNDRFGEK